MRPNPKQKKVINEIIGIFVVDAGPGTGKTTTITQRYGKILDQTNPDDILLLTFTDNAAENMRDKIINECSDKVSAHDLMSAPITTFHSFCNRLIKQHGYDSPKYLGIEESLGSSYKVVENKALESALFIKFFHTFQKDNKKKYEDTFILLGKDSLAVLSMIKKLCCKGVFPTKDGWFSNGEEILLGDFEGYKEVFDELNEPIQGKKGLNNSELRGSFTPGNYEKSLYLNAPSEDEMFHAKQINPAMCKKAFDEDRKDLLNFVHEAYFEYIKFCLKRNMINFDFMIMFALLLLYHDHELREKLKFSWVMVDEFQDTNEMQFMLTMLLMKTNNLCAVGDWKQGIYRFRNATIDNILDFKEKLRFYKRVLNKGYERIKFSVEAQELEFDINHRSSDEIIRFSEHALVTPGTKDEKIDEADVKITRLKPFKDLKGYTGVEFLQVKEQEEELDLILAKIQELVNNKKILIKDLDDEGKYYTRKITYKDIAVLSRTRNFGLDLQEKALEKGIPVNYDGGIELYRTEPALMVLAWLRILLNLDKPEGWIPILEKKGYNYAEIKKIVEEKRFPKKVMKFREELLKEEKNVVLVIDKILKYYGFSDNYSNALVTEIESMFNTALISVSDLLHIIESNVDDGEISEIDINLTEDAVSIQTIHKAKGLEYPIVFVVDCNQAHFPSTQTDKGSLFYDDLLGLRLSEEYGKKKGYYYRFGKWQIDLLASALSSVDYDEERRLLYVAITRAKQYVFLTSFKKRASMFFTGLGERHYGSLNQEFKPVTDYPLKVEKVELKIEDVHDELKIGKYDKRGIAIPTHDLMEYEAPGEGKGLEFGAEMHEFACRIALGKDVKWDEPEAEKIRKFITGLKAKELKPEVDCSLPLGGYLIRGVIDLIAVYDDRIEIIDYKSDLTDLNEKEYKKQMSVYYHVLKEVYPNKKILCKLYYVCQNKIKEIKPLSEKEIERLLA